MSLTHPLWRVHSFQSFHTPVTESLCLGMHVQCLSRICHVGEGISNSFLPPLTHALIGYPLHGGQGLPLKKCPIIRKWEVTWAWVVLQGPSRHLNMKLNGLHLLSFSFFLLMTTVHFCW